MDVTWLLGFLATTKNIVVFYSGASPIGIIHYIVTEIPNISRKDEKKFSCGTFRNYKMILKIIVKCIYKP